MPTQPVGFSTLLGLGVVVAAQLAIGLALGLLADHLAGTAPLFLFVGLVLGVAGCVVYVVARFRAALSTGPTDPPARPE